ncbi:MAG TPA: DUF512 domain-containing protein [Tissierellaceae bacterium]|nr:DUF512 domain-containing protein [Tissierellaceae bacterium]
MELRNYTESRNIIEEIAKGSIADELEIEAGDVLLSINNSIVKDIIDYKYLMSDDNILLEVEKTDGQVWEYEIEKDFDEDLGIIFTNPLIDKAKSCRNKCIFCFIDQLPANMRETLYFKDDDSRLSFLQGNFITLTNMSDDEIDRIIKYRLSPINISVHTTNPDLRIRMLNNKNAGKLYDIMKKFHQASLQVNCQIVLVPGVNDGRELERTLSDLSELYPTVESVAVVPIGVTKYREKLAKVDSYDEDSAGEVLDFIEDLQANYMKNLATRFIFLSDEFYALSKRQVPSYGDYEGFPQLENGVGLMRLFHDELEEELLKLEEISRLDKKYIVATGTLAYDYLVELFSKIRDKLPGLEIEVVPIVNNFFGEKITVSGLITGYDLISQLKGKRSDGIIIPSSMMKCDEEIFLDNISIEELSRELNTKIIVSKVNGKDLMSKLILGVDYE